MRRAIRGPMALPASIPAASGATTVQPTLVSTAKVTAAAMDEAPTSMFFSALARARWESTVSSMSESSNTPVPAPKYPL